MTSAQFKNCSNYEVKRGRFNMSINKNDCLDCANSFVGNRKTQKYQCSKGHIITKDKNGIVEVLDEDCEDFEYQQ